MMIDPSRIKGKKLNGFDLRQHTILPVALCATAALVSGVLLQPQSPTTDRNTNYSRIIVPDRTVVKKPSWHAALLKVN